MGSAKAVVVGFHRQIVVPGEWPGGDAFDLDAAKQLRLFRQSEVPRDVSDQVLDENTCDQGNSPKFVLNKDDPGNVNSVTVLKIWLTRHVDIR